MALAIKTGPTLDPLRLVLHGQEGVGKTTWAAGCPGALFLTAEDGGGDLEYTRAVLDTWDALRDAVRELVRDAQGFRTVVIDTIDTYERLLWQRICVDAGADSIENVGGGYGKGYTRAAEEMGALQRDLDALRVRQRVNVILLAHSHVRAFNDPLGAPYDRYEVRLHKGTADLWKGWADAVLFACFDITVMKSGKKGRIVEAGALEKGKALEGAKRVIYTSKEAAYDAKNRHSLPDEMPLSWPAFAKAIRWTEREAAGPKPKPADHHPSWTTAHKGFFREMAEVGVNATLTEAGIESKQHYETVARFCEAKGRPRPSQMDDDGRRTLVTFLESREGLDAIAAFARNQGGDSAAAK